MARPGLIPSLLVLLVTAGCAGGSGTPAPPPPLDAAAMRDTIQAREKEWSAAFVAGDAAGIASLYTEDGASVTPSGDWDRGREGIAAGLKKQLDTVNVSSREDITEEVIVVGDHVVEIGHFTFAGTSKATKKPVSGSGRYMVLWRKDADGQWRLHRDLGNNAPPAKM